VTWKHTFHVVGQACAGADPPTLAANIPAHAGIPGWRILSPPTFVDSSSLCGAGRSLSTSMRTTFAARSLAQNSAQSAIGTRRLATSASLVGLLRRAADRMSERGFADIPRMCGAATAAITRLFQTLVKAELLILVGQSPRRLAGVPRAILNREGARLEAGQNRACPIPAARERRADLLEREIDCRIGRSETRGPATGAALPGLGPIPSSRAVPQVAAAGLSTSPKIDQPANSGRPRRSARPHR
jgi:hypothetical protein